MKGVFQDLTGRKFGRLTVVERATKPGEKVRWLCQCECGGSKVVEARNLTCGKTKSCGCLTHNGRKPRRPKVDLTGRRFGRLTVVERLGYDTQTNSVKYACRCDCGNETVVSASNLRTNGHTTSCGCLQEENRHRKHSDARIKRLIKKQAETPRSNNTSGRTGVYYIKEKKKWRADITFKGKKHELGYFEDFEAAVIAREEAEHALLG